MRLIKQCSFRRAMARRRSPHGIASSRFTGSRRRSRAQARSEETRVAETASGKPSHRAPARCGISSSDGLDRGRFSVRCLRARGRALHPGYVRRRRPPRWIVFSARPNGTDPAQLFRVRDERRRSFEQITTGRLPATAPAFSPDGTRIVFSRLGAGIFRVNLDGTGLRRLTSNSATANPSGRRTASPSRFCGRTGHMARLRHVPSGGGKKRLAEAPPAGRPSWTANSKSILIPSGGDMAKIDAADREGPEALRDDDRHPDLPERHRVARRPVLAYVGPRLSTGPPDCGEGRCPQFGLYLANLPAPSSSATDRQRHRPGGLVAGREEPRLRRQGGADATGSERRRPDDDRNRIRTSRPATRPRRGSRADPRPADRAQMILNVPFMPGFSGRPEACRSRGAPRDSRRRG